MRKLLATVGVPALLVTGAILATPTAASATAVCSHGHVYADDAETW